MKLNARAIVDYFVDLDSEDIEKIKKRIEEEKIDFIDDKKVCEIISDLCAEGKISLYDDWKCTESDFITESIEISEFEERTVEEIFEVKQIKVGGVGMKYTKKPVEVEAFKYNGDFKDRNGNWYVPDWAVKAFEDRILHYNAIEFDKEPELFVDTIDGTHMVRHGDYIIRGIKGELYNVRADIFEETYEMVKE